MLKEILSNRFTAKWWENIEVERIKIEYILDTAYLAPSKNSNFNFNIFVITNSQAGKNLKQWLYWENTYCVGTVRAGTAPGPRRYNGQVTAPVVLLWVAKDNDSESREDCLVSATVAMCAALEQNLQTGFCSCLGETEIPERINIPGYAITSLGIGHALTDMQANRFVFKNGKKVGFDYSNTNPARRDTPNRIVRPEFENLIRYI